MRGILAVALIALGTALPVSADTGARYFGASEQYVSEIGAADTAALASRVNGVPEAAIWTLMIGSFGLAGALRRPRA